ncbi:hypothetical protein [uncultured Clostridium sp.]|jgi:hypothetical protein|uniref:hypothetical protein n=1 Tax=uncultured Clostridium sp. TaxID=59620 RepID=UPI00262C0B5A|nr:hypothetical protein [uncultured Clostridium sp.]
MEKLYLVELINYHFDSEDESINQDDVKILGLYKSEADYKVKVEKEIASFTKVSKTEVKVIRDEELEEDCVEVLDIVSQDARVTIIVSNVSIGDSKNLVDYNRINYYYDYDKTIDVEVINIEN